MGYSNQEEADQYQSFYNFMSNEHGQILTISEMDEIISEALKTVKSIDVGSTMVQSGGDAAVKSKFNIKPNQTNQK